MTVEVETLRMRLSIASADTLKSSMSKVAWKANAPFILSISHHLLNEVSDVFFAFKFLWLFFLPLFMVCCDPRTIGYHHLHVKP